MLGFSALVAGSFSLGALAAPHVSPAVLNAIRFAVAAAILGTVVVMTTGVPAMALRASWRYLVLGGIFGAYFVMMFEGLKTAHPVSAAAVFTLTPVMTAGFGWLMMRQAVTGRIVVALALGAAGALWVIFRADLAALIAFEIGRGELIYFVGCIAHAAYTPMTRLLNRGEPMLVFTLGITLGALAVLTVWALPSFGSTDWAALPAIVWVTIAYVAVFASATTVFLLAFAAQVLPASKVMAYTYLTPSWVLLWQLALGEALPQAATLGGVGLTVLALVLLLKSDPRHAH